MPLLLIFGLPILEIYVFIQVANHFGFVNAFFATLVSMVLGVGIAKSQGKFMFRHLQQSVSKRAIPEAKLVHSLLIFIGGVLMVVPGFVTTVAGLVFILPGTRHLLAFWLKAQLLAQIGLGKLGVFGAGGVRGFKFGMGGFSASGFGGPNGPSGFGSHGNRQMDDESDIELDENLDRSRDVTPRVIDVTPIQSQTRPTSKPESEN